MHRSKHFILLVIVFLITACSTSKNKFINREYHILNTRYNVLFNGKEAFEIGEEILEKTYEDNFFELLSVEPISLKGENFDEPTIIPGFDRAEEKAVKAIQKHSMNIKSVQYNRQIDDAYLLLGKARYFDRRFFPALEAFNFLLQSNTTLRTYNEGRIWREKTNIRLKNNDFAIENLSPLANSLTNKDPNYSLANATLGEAFINVKKLDSASHYIQRAAKFEKNKNKKARYLFISGQLHEALSQKDSALWDYDKIIALKRKVPRKFNVNAKLKRFLLAETNDSLFLELAFNRMLKNYENNPFKHSIYRAMGTLYNKKQNDSLTKHYLNKSLQEPSIDLFTKTYNYNDLIDLNFNNGNYVRAGNYLDSLIPLYGEKTFQRKRTQRKRDNLEDVIVYETIAKETDSLLYLLGISKEEQLLFFENYLNKKREAERLATESKNQRSGLFFTGREKSAFYFYNPSLLVKGKQQYRSTWGNRPNVDNWRNASLLRGVEDVVKQKENKGKQLKEIIVETPENFVMRLTKIVEKKDSIIESNHKAYLQLGMIYKEKYKNTTLAINRLTNLLDQAPEEKLAVPALYHLFKIYEKDNPEKSKQFKEQLVEKYPETTFAKILINPKNYSLDGIQTPETQYVRLYKKFQAQEFETVIEEAEALIVINSGSEYEAKLKLLKANSIGRLNGVAPWKVALKEVIDNYPKAIEGKYAQDLLTQINVSNDLEEQGKKFKNYKWVFPFSKKDTIQTDLFYSTFSKEVNGYMRRWNVSYDSYDKDYNFIVVHGIRNRNNINTWIKSKGKDAEDFKKTNYFVVLAHNYRKLIKNKTWKAILNSNEE